MGYTLDLPVLAPMTAPPEDKKLILTQTVDRIADAGVGDWPSKTTLLTQRFAMAVPNATNEAKVRLAKFKDFTSDMFVFGPPIGLMSDMQFTPLHQTVVLRYLSFELRVLSKLAPPVDAPVPNLPGERCIQAIMKVPLNEQQTDVHNCCTQERLGNVKSLIEAMIQEGLERTIGKHSMVSRSLDTMLFDKEFKMVYGEAMFRAVTAVLLRDYVGKGITKDIQKRLRDCKQVAYIAGKRRVKSVEEQHADFMRLVQEFDVDEQIPANLPSIAFHNASYDIQQELQHMKYEPPSECSSIAEQYKKLSEFHERAKEAESRLAQVESMIRRVRGPGTQVATAFLSTVPQPEEGEILEENPDQEIWGYPAHPYRTLELVSQNRHLRAMLSVVEKAIRRASGEIAPLECWGCKDFPEYQEDKFHRYRSCPRRDEPKIRANFERNLRTWTSKKRPSQYERPSGRNPAGRIEKQKNEGKHENRSFLTTLENSETDSASNETEKELQHLAQVSQDTNLLTEFGIYPEQQVGKKVRFKVNMVLPSGTSSPMQEDSDRLFKIVRTTGIIQNCGEQDWAMDFEQMLAEDVKSFH